MSDASPAPGVCPRLALRDDPATHLAFASTAQACHAGRRPASIDAATQATLCLTDGHQACPRYRAITAPVVAGSRPTAVRTSSGRGRALHLVLLVAILVAIALGGIVIGSQLAALSALAPAQPITVGQRLVLLMP